MISNRNEINRADIYDDFGIVERYTARIIKEIEGIKNIHTKPQLVIPLGEENISFIEVRCFVQCDADEKCNEVNAALSKESTNGDIYELRYRIVCPLGYWGDNRKKFIEIVEQGMFEL